MLAAESGHKDVILLLIKRGANVNLVDAVSVYVHILLYYKAGAHERHEATQRSVKLP